MEQYSKFFQKSYLGDTNTDTQLNKFLEEHPNYVVDKVSFENPKGTCIENLFVVFKEKQPTADVVEVVRCKECMFNVANMEKDPLDTTDYSDITCSYFMTDGMTADDFCSYGKKVE